MVQDMTEQAIDFLGWLPMSDRLRGSLLRAQEEASESRAAEISIEHLLRAFDEDVDVNVYLARCGVEQGLTRPDEPSAEGDALGGRGDFVGAADNWGGRASESYGDGYADRVSDGSYSSGFGGGYGAASTRAAPRPSRELRRLMAKASLAAETLGRDEVSSDLALQALALDADAAAGRRISAALPAAERARIAEEIGEIAPRRAQSGAEDFAAAPTAPRLGGEAAFKELSARIEALLMTLHGELQKDMRYRIANDLAAFMTQARPGEEALQNSALPILHATRAELERDPHYAALERVRSTLRAVRAEEGRIRAALGGLAREGRLEPGGALANAAASLVELPAPDAFDAEKDSERSGHELEFAEARPFAGPSLPGPALVHAARAGASPWEGLASECSAEVADAEDEDRLDLTSPSASMAVEQEEQASAPIFGRVFRSVRPGSMFSRRRSGAA